MRGIALAALPLALLAGSVGAQSCETNQSPGTTATCSVSSTVSITTTAVAAMQLSLSSTSTLIGAPTVADFDAGLQVTPAVGPTFSATANSAWTLSIRAASAVWSSSNGRVDKPVSDLRWSLSASGTYTPLSTTDRQIAAGSANTPGSGGLFFKVGYSWLSDVPGNYTTRVILTITAP